MGSPGIAGASTPTCSSAIVDTDGDGWGYESNQSCRIADGHPPCSSNAVVNGEWGYENGVSCVVTQSNAKPTCSADAIDNGGGWGWENNASCRWAGGASPTTNNNNNNNGYPTCTSAAANNGGGWGYENGESCRYSEDNNNEEKDWSKLNISIARKALMQLPDGYRTVLTLYLIEGYDHSEISEILGIAKSTSLTQYKRGKDKLKMIIKKMSENAQY